MDSETLVALPEAQAEVRPPPKSITLLLPVWGYRFVLQFLEFCLPTMLAPGNIPAVAAALPTRFVVLSRERDEDLIRSHPTWIALQKFCTAEVGFIDDLITDGNHTATITLAFARAVRQTGEAMTDTGFVFLMSDYLFADGSLRTLVNHFLNGASGVVAGNFQIIAEEAAPELQGGISPISQAIILPARDLLAWSLDHLHPATTANIVNFRLNHNAHTNRLLWRVDEHTVIGRFYLMHPIGVRPEVTNFVVGSSLDYSFIPEMCPSGNVVTLADSDDYFVIEMQPRQHERANLRAGPLQERELAVSLAEWTTIQHRANIAQTIVYHSAEVPERLGEAIAEADAFIDRVSTLLSLYPPQPFRNHHYWVGSIASNRLQTGQALSREDWRFLLGESVPSAGVRGFIWRVRKSIFGTVPEVTRFHERWPDYNMPWDELRQVVSNNGRLLVVADQPSRFAHWVTAMTSDVFTLEWDRLLAARPTRALGGMPEWYRSLVDTFDACLVVVTEPMLETAAGAVERLGPLMKLPSQIAIMILNDRPFHNASAFSEVFARSAAELLDHSSWRLEIRYIPATRLRWLVYRLSDAVLVNLRDAYKRSLITMPIWGGVAIGLGIATYLVNFGIRSTTSPPSGLWSSVFLMLRRKHRDSREEQYRGGVGWSTPRISNRGARNLFAASDDGATEDTITTTEVAGETGGPSSIRKAHEIAAKLLAGRQDVGIYGFDEADAVSLAEYNVRRMAIYDSNPATIVGRRQVDGPPLPRIQFHDMLGSPLPRVHDSICSLRTLGYVPRAEEDAYIEHLADSLARSSDILIFGCPSNVAPEELAVGGVDPLVGLMSNRPTGKRRYQYARTGAQLKAQAERFFENVFVFSIVDGEVQPGTVSSADYVLAVCCARKGQTEQSRSGPRSR
jgi:hypothetical protein